MLNYNIEILVEVIFYKNVRKTLPYLKGYRPHFRVKNTNDYLGIIFTEGELSDFEVKTIAIIKPLYKDIDYESLLENNTQFDILEGKNIVGKGYTIGI